MPIYDYRCEKCEVIWEESHPMSSMNAPTKEPCPHCEEDKCVVKHVGGFPGLASDATLTANKKTGGQWNELMGRMKNVVGRDYKHNLDKASERTGTRWKG
jgi:putative FmdB family regulatory protein